MPNLRHMTRTLLRRFAAERAGAATLEFVILAPALFVMLFSLAEAGVLMTRSVMLDRGVNIAIRDLRLGLTPGITHDQIKDRICQEAFLLSACDDALLLELRPVVNAASFTNGSVNCIDRTENIDPTVAFDPGARSEIMFVRACVVVDPLFPGVGLGAMLPKDASGGYALVSQTAFVNEPS